MEERSGDLVSEEALTEVRNAAMVLSEEYKQQLEEVISFLLLEM